MEVKYKHKEGVTVGYRDGQLATIDSREVAEMMEKEHKHILQYIEGNKDVVGIRPVLESQGLDSQKYFIPSTYKAGTREYKCYLVTKMGCELLGNKQQGEKGILFTAKYVEAFNKMEEHIKGQTKQLSNFELTNQMMNIMQNTQMLAQVVQGLNQGMGYVQQYVQDSIQAKDHQIDKAMELIGLRARNVSRLTGKLKEVLAKKYGRLVNANDIKYIKAKDKIFREFDVFKWEEIPVGKYNAVFAYIEEIV